MTKKYNYFYRITNNLNNHFYYGVHSTNDLNDGYMGSGKRLKYAYEKYGIENFSKEILKFFENRNDAYKFESEVVTESLVKDNKCYNCTVGGVGNSYGSYGLVPVYIKGSNNITLVSKEEFSKNREKYETAKQGKTSVVNKITGEKLTISVEEYRNNQDIYESIQKNKYLFKDSSGKIYWFDDKNNELIKRLSLVNIRSESRKGRKLSEETKEKIRRHHLEHGIQKGNKNSNFGKIWITNGKESKTISLEELDEWMKKGWLKGRKSNESQRKFNLSKNEVIEYRKNRLTWKEIGNIANVSDATVRRFAKKNDIQ